ncbi:phage tail tube protein [Fusobacterium necrophorum]|uniref:Phage tail tube protein n=1 Tax=Fusobacterium necrophorum TaxID=859 RepID=A0AAW6WGY2_9FUSO|nr:phage tail tube protein [Fusobacterium necrophorum]MDK4481826.1 phage tail tube protein [Fusobacterium necrophorum]MDK4512949.1 phage tail tube protein [Fusobacterium necrophorum]
MATIKVYLGKQKAEKQKCENKDMIDAGATDFNVEESITPLKSERFMNVQAEGDSTIGKIDLQGSIPIEFSKEILEILMPAISYTKTGADYKMSTNDPAFYTIVLVDESSNEKWEYVDCMISNMKLNIALGGFITGSIDIVGKTYEIGTGKVTGAKPAGDSLRALFSNINLAAANVSADIEGVDIEINNGVEAKGSLNSLYNVKFRRTQPQETKVSIQKNEYNAAQFKEMKDKMIKGTSVAGTIKLGKPGEEDTIVINLIKMFINSNQRGDYKGAGTHNIELLCSANNADSSHLKFTFKEV